MIVLFTFRIIFWQQLALGAILTTVKLHSEPGIMAWYIDAVSHSHPRLGCKRCYSRMRKGICSERKNTRFRFAANRPRRTVGRSNRLDILPQPLRLSLLSISCWKSSSIHIFLSGFLHRVFVLQILNTPRSAWGTVSQWSPSFRIYEWWGTEFAIATGTLYRHVSSDIEFCQN